MCCWPLLNGGFALAMLRAKQVPAAGLWLVVPGFSCMHAFAYFLHGYLILPKAIRET